MKKKDRCAMDGCNDEAHYKESGLCKCCYAFMYYWKDRSVTDRMKHAQKIERWDRRAHAALVPKKVSTIRRKRAAR